MATGRDILNSISSTGFWGSVGIGGSWPSRMPPCPPQQSRNRGTQLPTLEPGEMELTWQEIMSITELQVSWVGNKVGELGWAEASRVLISAGKWTVVRTSRVQRRWTVEGKTSAKDLTGVKLSQGLLCSHPSMCILLGGALSPFLTSFSHLFLHLPPLKPALSCLAPLPPGSIVIVQGPGEGGGESDSAGVLCSG